MQPTVCKMEERYGQGKMEEEGYCASCTILSKDLFVSLRRGSSFPLQVVHQQNNIQHGSQFGYIMEIEEARDFTFFLSRKREIKRS